MRKKLQELDHEKRYTFTGFVERPGKKRENNHWKPTLLLTNLMDIDGNKITDHVWINYTKGFRKLGLLTKGDKVQFDGRVDEYIKEAIIDRERNVVIKPPMKDYSLVYPTKIKLLNNHIAKQPVPENNAEFLRYIGDVTHDLKRMKRYFSNGW
ncbi:hypothetical protein [Pediococcus pentosaceus]|uniref:hypothetical protein n=1 Tax=Pediococcus pentosaceus TaxID=1255 RepID=UPI003B50E6AA